jgi:hypothetical protein
VHLSWTHATDDFTPAAALTYDLELYRSDIPGATTHRLPQPGSISAVIEWALAGLPNGNYAWTLRAVDSAYNGGPVAKGTFAIGVPSGVEANGDLPRTFAFAQNSPNPFRGSTTFSFAIPERTGVKLTVYDAAGRVVTRLVDDTRAPGVYQVPWTENGLASGVYFARLRAGAFTKTQRMLLLK